MGSLKLVGFVGFAGENERFCVGTAMELALWVDS
ncbi:hypothetical protein SLEP1_g59427 [Rubroshorea leprosula]|uniref:Uncharacterized protein n=1 Tax=Rubroshorea leprosula TaxID=152421 RepID=A0AAV5MSA2_9ROSI|nr:hypothetical protein SLEP1_g59427 [Rubroshorea leprosula]